MSLFWLISCFCCSFCFILHFNWANWITNRLHIEIWIFFFFSLFSVNHIGYVWHGLQWVDMFVAIFQGHGSLLLGFAQPLGHQLTRQEVLLNLPGPGAFETDSSPQVRDGLVSERRAVTIITGEKILTLGLGCWLCHPDRYWGPLGCQ